MAKKPTITVSKTSTTTASLCSARSVVISSTRRKMESNVKVRNAHVVKIMFVFLVEKYPKRLTITRNIPKVIAAI
jgi:hypothetical protein